MAAHKIYKRPKDDDEKERFVETFLVNLSPHQLYAQIKSEKVVITDDYTKQSASKKDSKKSSKGGGGKIGIKGAEIGGNYTESEEVKTETTDELDRRIKLKHYLIDECFQIVDEFKTLKFSTRSELNYVTIYVDGVKKVSNWNTTDREVFVDKDGTIGSHPEHKISKHYDAQGKGDSLFSHAYQARMVMGLEAFKDLWYYAHREGAKILTKGTIKDIGQCGVDFFGVNMATSRVLSIVEGQWLGVSVKKLYNLGMDINSIPRDQVQYLLKNIAAEAGEIAAAWAVLSGWYGKLKSLIENTQNEIMKDNTDALKKQRKLEEERERKLAKVAKEAYNQTEMIVAGVFTLGIATGPMMAANEKQARIREEYAQKLREARQDLDEMQRIQEHMSELTSSLESMKDFSQLMCEFFKHMDQGFSNWSNSHSGAAKGMEFKSWTSEKCVEWAITLNDGQFKQYEEVLIKKFMHKKRPKNGKNLDQINEMYLEEVCDFEEEDAEALAAAIKDMVSESEVQYRWVKGEYDADLKWMAKQRHDITAVNDFLLKIQIRAAFFPKGATISDRFQDCELKSFNETVSPKTSAAEYLN